MKTRGNTLVAMLATIGIILILVMVFFMGGFGSNSTKVGGESLPARADGKGITIPGRVRYKAKDDVCRENLSQVRSAIQIAESSSADDKPPATLDELHIGSMITCPIDPHEPYNYDPATGKVSCPHPGHEKY